MVDGMIDLSGELLAASAKFPVWQQDALRRLSTGHLSENDYGELVRLALTETGAPAASHPSQAGPTAAPLDASHLTHAHSGSGPVQLVALHSVKGVNALEPGQRLEFAPVGLTVVYGENGAGKSGYSRLLRRACRARKAPAILPDVSVAGVHAPARAKIDTLVKGAPLTLDWVDGLASPDPLAHFAVFDRECERSFIDEHGEAAFVPPILARFDELVRAVDEVKRRIELLARSALPGDSLQDLATSLSASPQASALVLAVEPGLSDAAYDELLARLGKWIWTAESEAHLAAARKRHSESADPAARAKLLRTLSSSVGVFRTSLHSASTLLDDEAAQRVSVALERLSVLQEAAESARLGLDFSREPLSGIGSSPWQVLYRSAVEFARTSSESAREFPDTPAEARCPLCAQDLDAEARLRFARFKRFMTEETKRLAEDAQAEVTRLIQKLEAMHIPRLDSSVVLHLAEVLGPQVASPAEFEEMMRQVSARRIHFLECLTSATWKAPIPYPVVAIAGLSMLEQQLETHAAQAEATDNPTARAALKAQVAELEASKRLAEQSARVGAAIGCLRSAAALQRAANAINTRNISREGKAVAEKAITAGLQATFTDELDQLGASALMGASITPRAEKGKTVYGLALTGSATTPWKASGVLSEGEQRVVALAYFLAEARMAPAPVGLIIDDPVSSLDHRWAERIARRLASLAASRQIIVFTHSIAFMIELERCAIESSACMAKLFLARSSGGAGRCNPSYEPWERLNLKARIHNFKLETSRLRAEHTKNSAGRKYRHGAVAMCGDLRSAWERAVEEVVFNAAVERFGYAISTGRLKRAVCTDTTFKLINDSMTRLSAIISAHDKAPGAFQSCPTPGELEELVKDLETFAKYQREEGDKAEAVRKALENPPSPTISATAPDLQLLV